MHKLNSILIVEDELIIAQDMKEILQEAGYSEIYMARNYQNAVEILKINTIEIAILDINLNSTETGIELGCFISRNYQIPFIYLTSYSDEQTINEVKLTKPSGFIIKPYSKELLLASLEIALYNFYITSADSNTISDYYLENEGDKIINNNLIIKEKNNFHKILLDDILWFESDRNYVFVITTNKKYSTRSSLKKILDILPKQIFVRCFKNYIINVNKVDKFSMNSIFINQQEIPISRSAKEDVLILLKGN